MNTIQLKAYFYFYLLDVYSSDAYLEKKRCLPLGINTVHIRGVKKFKCKLSTRGRQLILGKVGIEKCTINEASLGYILH